MTTTNKNAVIEQIEKLDASLLNSQEKGKLAALLLQKMPEITGLIQKAAKDRETKTEEKFKKIKQETINGVCLPEKIENLIQDLSKEYTFLLSQVGVVENQLTQAEQMRVKLADETHGVRIATLPIAFLITFVNTLKECHWAKIIWNEKNGTKSERITDFARFVDIYIEPNMIWQDKVTFKMLLGGYLTQADYEKLSSKFDLRLEAYNVD